MLAPHLLTNQNYYYYWAKKLS